MMTYYPYSPPPPQHRQPTSARTWLIVLGLSLMVAAVVGVVGLAVAHHTSTPTASSSSTTSTSAPADDPVPQWYVAVCGPPGQSNFYARPDPYHQLVPDTAMCTSPSTKAQVYIEYWAPEYAYAGSARAGRYQRIGESTATITDHNGAVWLFWTTRDDPTGASLSPLAQYGFTITPAIR